MTPTSTSAAEAGGRDEAPVWIGPDAVTACLTPRLAVDALRAHLETGFSTEEDSPRSRVETSAGTFMQMPSAVDVPGEGVYVGTKLLSLTPANAERGVPVIQGVYQLFGGPHQSPLAVIDGASLTAVRTPAVSALGAELLLPSPARRLLVFGTGVQAWEHARTFAALFPLELVWVAGRHEEKAAALAARIEAELGVAAHGVLAAGPDSPELAGPVSMADLIVTCTSARSPLFRGDLVKAGAVVVAVGAHDLGARELDDALLGRARVLVESRQSALAEAGEIHQGLESGAISGPEILRTLSEAVADPRQDSTRPAVFKTTGMPWEDLALAIEVFRVSGAERQRTLR